MRVVAGTVAAALVALPLTLVPAAPATADTSGLVALTQADGIYVVRPDGSEARRVVDDGRSPALSPDGRKLAFIKGFSTSSEVYTVNTDGTDLRKLTLDFAGDADPKWSPDGTRLAWSSGRNIAVMNADGSDSDILTSETSAAGSWSPTWSPDGQEIAFLTTRTPGPCGSRPQVHVIKSDGTRLSQPLLADEDLWFGHWEVAWSGAGIAIGRQKSNFDPVTCQQVPSNFVVDIHVVSRDGALVGNVPRPPGHYPGLQVAWSPDGSELLTYNGGTNLTAYTLDGLSRSFLPGMAVNGGTTFDWSPAAARQQSPAVAPHVTVVRKPAGGYAISWTAVPGASAYRVAIETPVAEANGEWGYLVVDNGRAAMAEVPATQTTYDAPDVLTSDTNAIERSVAFFVTPVNSEGEGPRGSGRAGCAPAYFIAARGSGQNPDASGNYASGLGHRGERMY